MEHRLLDTVQHDSKEAVGTCYRGGYGGGICPSGCGAEGAVRPRDRKHGARSRSAEFKHPGDVYATSDYQARTKLAIAVSWLKQGDARGLAQAEAEYKDFIRFYPAMKEAAELELGEPLRKLREQNGKAK